MKEVSQNVEERERKIETVWQSERETQPTYRDKVKAWKKIWSWKNYIEIILVNWWKYEEIKRKKN